MHQSTNASGTVVWEAEYKPFGEAAVNPGSTVVSNWRMPGQYFDAESGLYYNYHRYYDPGVGRYLTPDPIGLEGGINLYAYVSNNPVNGIDPLGLKLLLQGSAENRSILLNTLSNIAGTQMTMNSDGSVSNNFNSPKKFSEVGGWLKEIINSKATVNVQFGEAGLYGGAKFNSNSGTVTLDLIHRNKGQEIYRYRGEPEDWVGYIVGGPPQYFTQEGALSHELLGHGLDYVRGDCGNNQNDAIKRANKVRQLLGIPLRYK